MRFTTTIVLTIVAASTSVLARYHDHRGIFARNAEPYTFEELDLYARDLYEGDLLERDFYEQDLYERDFYERDLVPKGIYARDASPEEIHAVFRRNTVAQLAAEMQTKQGEINVAHHHMLQGANNAVITQAQADFRRLTAELKAIQVRYNAAVAAESHRVGLSTHNNNGGRAGSRHA
ncbi:hypothetical protein MMC34_001014 [Xylographa carneopallida]|nr:hypothetical protein [Xylographa carneopallida]